MKEPPPGCEEDNQLRTTVMEKDGLTTTGNEEGRSEGNALPQGKEKQLLITSAGKVKIYSGPN